MKNKETLTKMRKRYLYYKSLTNLWFLGAVWIYFYRIYIDDAQIGLLDSIAFFIGLIFEIPSGAIADRIGRKKMVNIGHALVGIGLLTQAIWTEFITFIIGQSVVMIGISFVSGSDDALFFQATEGNTDSHTWKKLITRWSQITLITILCATIIGWWLHTIDPRIPWILTAIAFFLSTLTLIWVPESQPWEKKESIIEELREVLGNISSGLGFFFHSRIAYYIPIIFVIQGLFYTYGYGLLKLVLLDRFGFDPFVGSVVVGSVSLFTVLLLEWLHRYIHRVTEWGMFLWIGFLSVTSLIMAVWNIWYWWYIVILMLYAGEHLIYPVINNWLQQKSPETQRSTILSIASFLRTIPYIFLAVMIGYLNNHDTLEYFLIFWSILIVISLWASKVLQKK